MLTQKMKGKRWKLPNLMILKRLIGIHMTFALNVVRQKIARCKLWLLYIAMMMKL
nr:MAG TPA: hypothetical protein [Bacteriophage sp.]